MEFNMALTAIEREILKVARDKIINGQDAYICHAINKTRFISGNQHEVWCARQRLRAYIMKKLNGYSSLGMYLSNKYRQEELPYDLQREARIAWITWMLGEKFEFDAKTKRQFEIYMHPERALHSYDSSGHKVV
jgi:hypothetical protein